MDELTRALIELLIIFDQSNTAIKGLVALAETEEQRFQLTDWLLKEYKKETNLTFEEILHKTEMIREMYPAED